MIFDTKKIHMDLREGTTNYQFVLEKDINPMEEYPQSGAVKMKKGCVVVDSAIPGTGYVNLKGQLEYELLCTIGENTGELQAVGGSLEFSEKINMEAVLPSDLISYITNVDNLSINMLSGGRISLKAVVQVRLWMDKLKDVSLPVSVEGDAQISTDQLSVTVPQCIKEDVLRVKKDLSLPGDYANIKKLLWSDVDLKDITYRLEDNSFGVRGDVCFFMLYEEENKGEIVSYTTRIPFNESFTCNGCSSEMTEDIECKISRTDVYVKPDLDGENRNVGIEVFARLSVKIYGRQDITYIKDLYIVGENTQVTEETENIKCLSNKFSGKIKAAGKIGLLGEYDIKRLVYSKGHGEIYDKRLNGDTLSLSGRLFVEGLYETDSRENVFESFVGSIPFDYKIEIGSEQLLEPEVIPDLEELNVTVLDKNELDIKGIINFDIWLFEEKKLEIIREAESYPMDKEEKRKLCPIVVYYVKPGDSLWCIGKKYKVSVQSIMELNELKDSMIYPGDKLLILRN